MINGDFRWPGWGTVLRRIPFTLSVVAVMLALGIGFGTLWRSLESLPLFGHVAYGLPAFEAGRWWTVVTGALFALEPLQYLPVAGVFLLLVGLAEYLLGTRRTAIVVITGQAIAIIGAAGLLWVLTHISGYAWAPRLAGDLDVGFSAGMLAAAAASTVVMPQRWRVLSRLGLVLYALVSFLYVGVLWDLEHVIGVSWGLFLGPVLVGRRPRLTKPDLTAREWRIVAAASVAVGVLVRVGLRFVPADGPLGSYSDTESLLGVGLVGVLSLLCIYPLLLGLRWAWQVTGGLALIATVGFALLVPVIALDRASRINLNLPTVVVDLLLWAVQLAVLVAGRDAFTTSRLSADNAARG